LSQRPPERDPPRVRVSSPWTERPRLRPRPSATSEIDAQSEVGEIYVRTLLRAQLRLAVATLVTLGLTIGMLPLVFTLVPDLTTRHVLGMPVSWGVLGFGCYPVLVLLAWRYVRRAERNERAFARVVERS
jgi:putative solute:sodium symporter small subunit